ncbi:DUF6161 domain-containing protein [Mesorhizobium amorphae]|uniref:DUF6161 domain-containing protein n=1 Tax=Mesorhizobium amorphae TaxID=71433 RepID=UPI0011840C26|nr:DUF6161 domain-containing protein [Mesorhizobium amorphae]
MKGKDADWRGAIGTQPNNLRQVFLSTVEAAKGWSHSHNYEDIFSAYIERYAAAISSTDNYSPTFGPESIMISSLTSPFISNDEVYKYIAQLEALKPAGSPEYAHDFAGLFLAAHLYATRASSGRYEMSNFGGLETSVVTGLAKIEAYLQQRDTLPDERIAHVRARLDEIDTQAAGLAQVTATEKDGIASLQIRLEALKEAAASAEEDSKKLLSNFDGLKTSIEERLKLREATDLWGVASTRAAWAFYLSALLLMAILIGFPVTAYIKRTEIIDFITNFEKGVLVGAGGNDGIASAVGAFGRLLLISSPIGFVVWLIRLIARYNVRSMLLMDDARQRVTMLNTYLFLIEKDAAVKQDRGAILEALFRRAPGHGPDTVEQYNFTDLLRYGQDQAKPG